MRANVKKVLYGVVAAAAMLAPEAREAAAQEFARDGATLGALSSISEAVVEGDVRSVTPAGGGLVGILEIQRAYKAPGGAISSRIAVFTTSGDSLSVQLPPGFHGVFTLRRTGAAIPVAAEQSTALPVYAIEGAWLGAIDTTTREGQAVADRLAGLIAARAQGQTAYRRYLADGLSHWHPRVATDAAFDLEAAAATPTADEAAAVVRALDANLATFEDPRPLIRLAGRARARGAQTAILGILESPAGGHAVRDVAAALAAIDDAAAKQVLISGLERHASVAVRARIARVLGIMREPLAFDALVRVARSGEGSARRAAVVALGQLGDARAVPVLEPMLRGGDLAAAIALAEVGREGAERLAAIQRETSGPVASFVDFVRSNPAAARHLVAE